MSSSRSLRVVLRQMAPFSGVIDSIKIYGAIASAIGDLYGEAESFLQGVSEGETRVSSPMPVVGDRYYVFKPNLPLGEGVDYILFKRFKKMRFIREDVALRVLDDGTYDERSVETIARDKTNLYKQSDVPGVFVNRHAGKTKIYYKDSIFYFGRLWFILETTEEWRNKVMTALKYLGDVGISKKHTSGFGHFEIERIAEHIYGERRFRMLVSKYIPSREELGKFPFEHSRYSVRRISGYNRYGEIIPPVRVIEEGSTYPSERFESVPRGRVLNLTDRYSIVGVPVVI